MKKRLSGILLSLVLMLTMMPVLGLSILVHAEGEQSEEFTTNTKAKVYSGDHFKISVTDSGDRTGFDLSPPNIATIESLHGEIITKAEFTVGTGNGVFLTSQSGTVTSTLDTATVTGVNDTSLTVGGNDDPFNIEAVKVYYTDAVEYPLWINGTAVTSANRDNVLAGDGDNDGKVKFTPAGGDDPAILTLSGATINKYLAGDDDKAGILYDGEDPLNIVLEKGTTSHVTDAVDLGLYSSRADIVISGEGALSITGGPVYSEGDLTIEGGSVNVNKTNTYAGAIMGHNVTITDGCVEASAAASGYGIYAEKVISISGGAVTASGKRRGIFSLNGNDINIDERLSVRAGSSEADAKEIIDIDNWDHTEKWVKTEATAPIGPVSYLKWDDTQKKLVDMTGDKACRSYIQVDSNTTALRNGKWYVVDSDVTVEGRIFVSGTAHLILMDGKTLTAEKGINVKNKDGVVDALNIYAQSTEDNAGRLIATGEKYASGIGGNVYQSGGIISINGGNIEATGVKEGAGIGGGEDGDGGTITINGGNIKANGGYSSAGIGGGLNAYGGDGGDGGNITINGGTVNANGGIHGAGIGGGSGGDGGSITINGGTVNATGSRSDDYSYGGAGIGGGAAGEGGTVTINGGSVTAVGGGTTAPEEYSPAVGIGRGETDGDLSNGTLTVGTGLYVYGGNSAKPTTEIKKENNDYVRCLYMDVNNTEPHKHSFKYTTTAEGDTITATCTEDCPLPDHQAALTISAPDADHYEPVITDVHGIRGDADIIYFKTDGQGGKTGDPLQKVPTSGGPYWAEITLGSATAHVVYTLSDNYMQVTSKSYKGTYDGKPHSITVTVTSPEGAVIKYRTKDSGDYDLAEKPSFTDAGSYMVCFQVTKAGFRTVERYKTVEIWKADPVVTAPSAESPTFNGQKQNLVTEGNTSVGTMYYALGPDADTAPSDGWGTSVPEGTDAGTYYVWYKVVVDDNNYNDKDPKCVTAGIEKKAVKVSGITADDKTYDGTTDATLDCTGAKFAGILDGDALSVTADGEFADADAGTDKTVNISGLTLDGTSKDNYTLAAEGQQTETKASIGPKSITGATVTLDKTQLTYNGSQQSVNVTAVTTSDGLTLTENDYEAAGNTGKDMGDYEVTVTGKGNFRDTAAADWKIVEKAMTVKADNVTVSYDGKEHGITVKVIDPAGGAEVKYGTTEGKYDLEESPTIREPGTLTVYFKAEAGSNYSVYTGKAVVTVEKAASTAAKVTANDREYDGTEKELVSVTGKAEGGEMQYALGNDAKAAPAGGWSTTIPKAANAGTYYVWYKVAGDEHHKDTAPACVTVKISEKPAASKPVALVKATAKGKTALKFKWNKVSGAAKYEVWMAKCGKQSTIKKVKTLRAPKTSWTKKKLKKNTAYRFYVVAKDASGNVICKSVTGHAYTGNVRGKYTNAKRLKVKKSSFTLKKGGTAKIKATQTKARPGKKLCSHAELLRYKSNNTSVAKVSSSGKITAVGSGSCIVYVQTVNGIWKTVKIKVN